MITDWRASPSISVSSHCLRWWTGVNQVWHASSVFTDVRSSFFPHSGQRSCHPGSLSQSYLFIPTWGDIFHPTFVIIVSPYWSLFCWSDKQHLSRLSKLWSLQPTNHRGSLSRGTNTTSITIHKMYKGESKRIFCMSDFYFPLFLFLFLVPSLDFGSGNVR